MELKKKKICLALVLASLLVSSASVMTSYAVKTASASTEAYQPGTSYTNTHDVNKDTEFLNEAEEAHGFYWYFQNCDLLPVQVYYRVYPHVEGGQNVTMECNIVINVTYKGLFGEKKGSYSAKITKTELDAVVSTNKPYVLGHIDGPNSDALEIETVYTYLDASEGSCTWTITGK